MADGVCGFQIVVGQGVTGLMVGGDPLIPEGADPAALLGAHGDLHHGLADVGIDDDGAVGPGGQDGGLVQQILQVRSGEAGGGHGDDLQIHIAV